MNNTTEEMVQAATVVEQTNAIAATAQVLNLDPKDVVYHHKSVLENKHLLMVTIGGAKFAVHYSDKWGEVIFGPNSYSRNV